MGVCKALLAYRGTAFVDHVISAARSVVEDVVLLGGSEWNTPGSTGLPRLADEPDSGGPLAGLVPLLEHAGERWALLIACDMPLIDGVMLRRLLAAADEALDAVAFCVSNEGGEHFPCCALFSPRVVGPARSELARSRGIHALLGRIRCRVLEATAGEAHRLSNVNTPDEFAELLRSTGQPTATGAFVL